jgi:hypothetical protein
MDILPMVAPTLAGKSGMEKGIFGVHETPKSWSKHLWKTAAETESSAIIVFSCQVHRAQALPEQFENFVDRVHAKRVFALLELPYKS